MENLFVVYTQINHPRPLELETGKLTMVFSMGKPCPSSICRKCVVIGILSGFVVCVEVPCDAAKCTYEELISPRYVLELPAGLEKTALAICSYGVLKSLCACNVSFEL
ncbi:hypothetical protein RHMOL_Rhmol05G0323500 [Rhododendron molle]|uniref:Uncharacterized protein n=1 Tax=Rhododendron molle TaxID=49168 RepID=A0ACC0NXF1_RHOML|nr:hypothetical protein RHMOL_Rhmol05G0323500 [Rhododendron molle]